MVVPVGVLPLEFLDLSFRFFDVPRLQSEEIKDPCDNEDPADYIRRVLVEVRPQHVEMFHRPNPLSVLISKIEGRSDLEANGVSGHCCVACTRRSPRAIGIVS